MPRARRASRPRCFGDRVIPRCKSLCGFVVAHNEPLIVEDLALEPAIRRYADGEGEGIAVLRGHAAARGERAADWEPVRGRYDSAPSQPARTEIAAPGRGDRHVGGKTAGHFAGTAGAQPGNAPRSGGGAVGAALFAAATATEREGFSIWHYYHPVDVIGGDFLDAHIRPDGSLAAVVADVSGHGASAALSSAMVKTVFQTAAVTAAGPEDLLSSLQQGLGSRSSTAIHHRAAAVYDPGERSAHLASAGHP